MIRTFSSLREYLATMNLI